MAKKQYVVRIVTMNQDKKIEELLEQLRYAQLITIHRQDATGTCFDLHCPHGLVSEVWAQQNADRMQSFGYNAVKAPSASL